MSEPLYNYGERDLNTGDRVRTALYGDGLVSSFKYDLNLGWCYLVLLDAYDPDNNSDLCWQIGSALTPVPVVDQLADLV